MTSGPTDITLDEQDGAIIVRKSGMEFVVPPLESLENVEEADEKFVHVVNMLSFLMYASEREDWLAEFLLDAEQMMKEYEEEEKETSRPKLRIIQGGKVDEEE